MAELDNIMERINSGKAVCAFTGTGFVLRSKRFDPHTGEPLEDNVRAVTREELDIRIRTYTLQRDEADAFIKDANAFLAHMDELENNVAGFPDAAPSKAVDQAK